MARSLAGPAFFFPLLFSGLVLLSAACIPMKQARVAAVALTLQDVAAAAAKQSDTTIVREGTPAYLMLVDGLIEAYPDNRELLLAGCKAYASYASMFVADVRPKQGEALYRKARLYGFRALSYRADFGKAAAGNLDEFRSFLRQYRMCGLSFGQPVPGPDGSAVIWATLTPWEICRSLKPPWTGSSNWMKPTTTVAPIC